MIDRVRTLVLYSNGPYWQAIAADTLLQGVLGLTPEKVVRSPLLHQTRLRRLVRHRFEEMSYIRDWQEAFLTSPSLEVEFCNISNLVAYGKAKRKLRDYPLVVVLHSATGDNMHLLLRTADWFKRRRGKLLVFLGNEYDLMPEKIGFLNAVEADYIGSQLPLDTAQWLYAAAPRTRVVAAAHALNPQLYQPGPQDRRDIDVGFIGARYPYFIGDIERSLALDYFRDHGAELGLRCDIRTDRLARGAWAEFLQRCKGIVGAEAGSYYLERTDETKAAVQTYLKEHPDAPFEEIYARFFAHHPRTVSGKAISSRHFEPIGTQTCQVLVEGRYNDILVADEHYIALKKDLSNVAEAAERLKDDRYRTAMVERTYEYALAGHTYGHRVGAILDTIFANA